MLLVVQKKSLIGSCFMVHKKAAYHPPGMLLENSKKNSKTYSLNLLVQKFYTDVQMYCLFDFAQAENEQYH